MSVGWMVLVVRAMSGYQYSRILVSLEPLPRRTCVQVSSGRLSREGEIVKFAELEPLEVLDVLMGLVVAKAVPETDCKNTKPEVQNWHNMYSQNSRDRILLYLQMILLQREGGRPVLRL